MSHFGSVCWGVSWKAGAMVIARSMCPALLVVALGCGGADQVGPLADGAHLVATHQRLRPAGQQVSFAGRPVDVALTPDGRTLLAKDDRGLVVVDVKSWKVVQELGFTDEEGGSMHGLAISGDGTRAWLSTAQNGLYEAKRGDDERWSWARRLVLPGPKENEASHGCGVAFAAGESQVLVCFSRNNTLAIVNATSGEIERQIQTSVAPFDVVVLPDEKSAVVSNWGGRRARAGEKTEPSSGTPVVVDHRGIAASGTISLVDLDSGEMRWELDVGLHPADLLLASDGATLFVANANSDTVSVVDLGAAKVRETILTRPDDQLPFGSAPNALALTGDGATLLVANGGNNAVAVVRLGTGAEPSHLRGFIPTAWYPGALALRGDELFVANVKGFGSRGDAPDKLGRHVKKYQGTIQRVKLPDETELATLTAQVRADARVPQALRAMERAQASGGIAPVPVPERPGEPCVFEHVVYVIKENRTYDQVFGDMPRGNGEPSLCLFPRRVSPNHHALAEQFVLLDNFYCNGVLSADGHSWATEGNVTDHLEKSFGGFTRSYSWGDDPLNTSSSGFLWDHVLLHGLSFRNFGEMDNAETLPADAKFIDILRDFESGANRIQRTQKVGVEVLRRYTHPEFPGWNMKIPDVLRADVFLRDLASAERSGEWPNLILVHLPQDHTSGTSPGFPKPESHVADNDLALGRLVEGISKSRFWAKTCIFVVEDDPQDGFDHVDGHRSIAFVVSPYTRRGAVVSEFYNQTSVLHTMELMLGIPPMNQFDALAPVMRACFTSELDARPYTALPNQVPLDDLNPQLEALHGAERQWAEQSLAQPLDRLDAADEETFNRILWHAVKGVETPYPTEFAGAHGRGLTVLGLRLGPDDLGEEESDDGPHGRSKVLELD
jgi:YVTN family beta-propeller protein